MESLPVNLTDLIVLAILLISGGIAFALGFVRVLLLIGAWIGAAVVTLHGFSSASPIARRYIDVPLLADIAAGAVLFVVSLLVLFVVAMAVSAAVRRLGLGALDRALGFAFGVLGGGVIVCLIYLGISWASGDEALPDWMAEARSLPAIRAGAELLTGAVPEKTRAEGAAAAKEASDTVRAGIQMQKLLEQFMGGGTQNGDRAGGPGYNQADRQALEQAIRQFADQNPGAVSAAEQQMREMMRQHEGDPEGLKRALEGYLRQAR